MDFDSASSVQKFLQCVEVYGADETLSCRRIYLLGELLGAWTSWEELQIILAA